MALPLNQPQQDKILIIDDEPLNILALCAVLKSRGYHTITAHSAKEGMDKLLNDSTIKMVLMDMMMPELDGYEATQMLRENKLTRSIPIIAVTAQAMTHDREKCIAAGVNDYVSKPIDIDVLLAVITKYM